MLTLQALLANKTVPELLKWAESLDPNNSWDELTVCECPVTASQLAAYMVAAYDSPDVTTWINN